MKKWMIFAIVAICLCLVALPVILMQNNSVFGSSAGPTTEPSTEPTQETTQGVTEPPLQGVCGEHATWSLSADKSVLTISGTGDMYSCDPQPWAENVRDIKEAIVEEGITSIGAYAFKGCVFMTRASIPDTVVKIEGHAFYDCMELRDMQIPSAVQEIGTRAFYWCRYLESIEIPEGITTLEYGVFSGCKSIEEIDIPASVKTIAGTAFEYCSALKKVNFLGAPPIVERTAFDMTYAKGYYEYSNEAWTQDVVKTYEKILPLEALNVPPPPTFGTFGRSNIMEWKLENGTLYITGNGYMDGFSSLAKDMPWYPYREQIKAVVLTGNMQNIYSGAFMDCVNLKTVTWPAGLETVFDYVFAGCAGLEQIQIPDSVTEIMDSAFTGCTNLQTVKLPTRLRRISMRCFEFCEKLQKVELPANLRVISTGAFQWSGLKQITIPAGVEFLGESAFSNCVKLENVTFQGRNISTIPRFAFQDCQSLTSITLPSSIKSIEWDAFNCCNNLKAIYFRGNMPTLDTHFWMEVILYYPTGNKTWTATKMEEFEKLHGGFVDFQPYSP